MTARLRCIAESDQDSECCLDVTLLEKWLRQTVNVLRCQKVRKSLDDAEMLYNERRRRRINRGADSANRRKLYEDAARYG